MSYDHRFKVIAPQAVNTKHCMGSKTTFSVVISAFVVLHFLPRAMDRAVFSTELCFEGQSEMYLILMKSSD